MQSKVCISPLKLINLDALKFARDQTVSSYKMKASSENGPYSTNQRPFFYAQPTAQQPFPNPWFLGPMYNPYGIPTAGLRSGSPYFPFYSVPVQEYPGYLIPQHPMQMRVNRRPYFNGPPPSSPMFFQATRFRHYNPGKRTETKETQTDPRQAESKPKKHQDHGIEVRDCEMGNMACVSSGVGKDADISLEKPERAVSPLIAERDFAKGSAGSLQFRSLPPSGYAFEKEEVRIEYGNSGGPAIQLWKSFKETIPLYDVVKKPVPENVMQRDMFAMSSCEGVAYGPHEQTELVPSISYPEEQEAVEDVQETEPQYKSKLDLEKQGATTHGPKSPLDEARTVQLAEQSRPDQLGARQEALMSKRSGLKRFGGSRAPHDVSNLVRQRELFPSGMEIMNDSYFPRKLNENNDVSDEHVPTSEKSMWCDESEKYIPPEGWLACLNSMDSNSNYNPHFSRRKRPSVLSFTSDEMSSVDEDSSMDDAPLSYFASDYMLQNMYTFKKSVEGLEIDKIKSGGSLNEDEEVVGMEQANTSCSQNLKGGSRVKIKEVSSPSGKLGVLPRTSSKRHLQSLKKKATKSLSPSEADESEEYWVKEPEEEEEEGEEEEEDNDDYLNQRGSRRTLTPTRSCPYRQTGQQVIWRVPKNAVPAHLLSWPVQDKMKTATKLKKDQEQVEDLFGDYSFWLQRPTSQQLEALEARRNSQKSSGRLQKEGGRTASAEYWVKSGARPKFASLVHGDHFPVIRSRERGDLLLGMPKRKARKPPHKRRDTRHDIEVEEWEKPKATQHKGRGTRRSLYKRR
ncbi:uncharacterized protein LOC128423912 isoform X1 [Podarcis raffonei]|uniref:uncharacterized protein LOC128423912 isoform X1 n=2 Tax=Podarcis raffonei TaxID=65483 RepID=UPI0023299003|nr:uncharacterized protein LOC128423912 isoform X1 [Podarcis raffonei]